MSPTIGDDCAVVINLDDTIPKDGRVYFMINPDGAAIIKRLSNEYSPQTNKREWIVRSDNQDKIAYPDKILPPDNSYIIVGRCIWNDNSL